MNDQAIQVHKRVLDNGLTVVAVQQPFLHAVDVSLFVRCGSRHESANEWGLSHLLEHMLFRGSHKHPTSYDLACAFERRGGSLNASTWRDHTHFETAAHPSSIEGVVSLLGEMVTQPLFPGLDLERTIIEEEIQGELDEDGEDVDLNNLSRAAIWRDHAMGRRITGSVESLLALNTDDIRRHHSRFYVATNSVLCVSGRVNPSDVFRLAEHAFRGLPAGSGADDGQAAHFSPPNRMTMRECEGSQITIGLSFEALPDPHHDFIALEVATRVLDDGLSSRLHQNVCERRGLVYDLTTGLDCYADCGLYDIELSVAPQRATLAVAATLETLEELVEYGVSQDELDVTRDRCLHELEFTLDSAHELSSHFGASTLFRKSESLSYYAERLRALRPEHIVGVAERVFHSGRLHGTLMGPLERTQTDRIASLLDQFAGVPLLPELVVRQRSPLTEVKKGGPSN